MKTVLGIAATGLAVCVYAVMFGCLIHETVVSIKNKRKG